MSLITFDFSEDSALGVGAAAGMVTCYPARRRVSGSTIVLRKPFTVNLVNGVGSVDLAPNVPGTAWMITVSPTSNNDQYSGYYVVTQGDSNFKELIEVDPDTLEVDVEPEPAWWAMARSTVSNGTVNSDGDLILARADGTSVNAGHVVGAPGKDGASIKGDRGDPGKNGVGFSSAELTSDGDLNLIQDTGDIINVGHVVGSDGVDGVDGAVLSGSEYNYTVSETAGRTISLWDYANQRYQLVYGDTGELDVSSLVKPETATVGYVTLSRSNNIIELSIYNLQITNNTSSLIFGSLPVGFRPITAKYYALASQVQGSSPNRSSAITTSGNLAIYNTAIGDTFRETFIYKTGDPWPTTLPGVSV